MKAFFFFISCCFLQFGFSQSNQSLEAKVNVNFSYRLIDYSGDDPIIQSIEDRRMTEVPSLNIGLGIFYNKRLTNRLILKTGLNLAKEGYKSAFRDDIRYPNQHDGNGGHDGSIDPGEGDNGYQFKYQYWFIQLPMLLRYEFETKKWNPFIEGGLAPSFHVGNRFYNRFDNKAFHGFSDGVIQNFNSFQLASIVSFGVNVTIKPSIQMYISQSFSLYLTDLVDAPISEKLYNTGLNIGLRKLF